MNERPFICLALLVFFMAGCPCAYAQTQQSHGIRQPESNRIMAEFLADLAKDSNDQIARHMPNPDLRNYFAQIKRPLDPRSRIILLAQRAYRLLVYGKDEKAARQFLITKTLAARSGLLDRHFLRAVRECLAIAYLRAAEKANHVGHDEDVCVLLLSDFSGGYKNQRWSRAAIKEYKEILTETPNDLTARWLLNIAYMTIGDYPTKVPKAWLISPEHFKSDYEMKRFRDIAPRLGLDVVGRAGGVITEDFDRDGYIDIMVSSAGLGTHDQLRYFHNDGNGTFSDRTVAAGLKGITGGLNISSADYNNDGYNDVFIPRGAWLGRDGRHPSSLLKNNGDGTFTDETAEAGLFTLYPSNTAVWADFDNDGWIDLFVGNETTPQDTSGNPCQLFHNNGDGTFSDVAGEVGLEVYGWIKGAAWGDYDNDGLPDLYISRLFEPNLLLHNDGKHGLKGWRFTDVTAKAGVADPLDSYSCWFWDYDNDGWQDLFVASASADDFTHTAGQIAADYLGQSFTAETPRLYQNNHDGTFKDVTKSTGLHHALYTMGGNFGDIDNDGWPDIYLGTGNPMYQALMPNRMIRNAEGKYFQDVSLSAGLGHLQKGHGIAFADLDNDGDQDIFAVLGGVYPGDTHPRVLFENPGSDNHWITLRLEGTRSNHAAIGARIKVNVTVTGGTRNIFATVSTGGSMGASALQQLIGLGHAIAINSIEVTWPASGQFQIFKNVQMDRILKIREGEPEAQVVSVARLNFDQTTASGK